MTSYRNSKPRRNLGGVAQKGLLIVGLPLLLQLFLLAAIVMETRKVEANSVREAHYRRLLTAIGELSVTTFDVFSHFNKYIYTHAKGELVSATETLERMDHAVAMVKQETGKEWNDLPGAEAQLTSMTASAEELCQIFHHTCAMLGRPLDIESACSLYEYRQRLVKLAPKFIDEERQLLSLSMQLASSFSQEQMQARSNQQAWILVAALASAFMAIVVGNVFNRGVCSRLNVIQENTILLGQEAELNPPVGGNDEIQQLDEAFRNMAQALKSAREDLVASERMRSEMYALIAHDIRNPLLSIKSAISSVLDVQGTSLDDRERARLLSSNRNVNMVTGLINDLLDVEKFQSGKFDICAVRANSKEIIDLAVDSVQQLLDAKSLNLVQKVEDCDLLCDRDLLVRVLTNLLSNAIKFSPMNGAIALEVERTRGEVRFSVRDQGPGIAEHEQEKLFRRFSQTSSGTHSRTNSSGLGLAICKMIVDEHDGRIAVVSEEGSGSEFWFTIPTID